MLIKVNNIEIYDDVCYERLFQIKLFWAIQEWWCTGMTKKVSKGKEEKFI